jgi:curved DNA-binding protein CbpA
MEYNHYQVLGIPRHANAEEIKKAYKTLAKKYHPDVNPGNVFYEEHFKKVNQAHAVLSDATKRKAYDNTLYQLENPTPYRPTPTAARPAHKKTTPKAKSPSYALNISPKQGFAVLSFFVIMSIGAYFFYHFMNEYTSNQHFKMGLAAEQKGDANAAVYYYHQALEMDKQNYKVHKQLAYCLLNNSTEFADSYVQASYLLNVAINHTKGNTDSMRYQLAQCYILLDDYEKALTTLEQITPHFNDSTFLLKGECYIQKQLWHKSLEVYEEYLKKHPLSDLSFQKIAYTHYKNVAYEKAKDNITKAIIIAPSNGAHYYIRGLIAIGEHDTTAACHYFNSSYDLAYEKSERAINTYCQ